MKCDNVPFLWRKLILNMANSRDYVNKYCIRPPNSFDRHCRGWYIHNLINSSDNLDELPGYDIYFL